MFLESLVIGNCTTSALYAILSDSFYLINSEYSPVFYKKTPVNIFGQVRDDFSWSRLNLLLSLQGLLLNYEKLENIRVSKDLIKFSSDTGARQYKFKQCKIFNPTGVSVDTTIKVPKPFRYIVYDDFELSNLGAKHRHLEPKISEHDFAREINYYTSTRVAGANYVTDCVVESIMSESQIRNVDYSDSIVRFAVERHLKEIGVFGNFMKNYKSGKPKYRKPKVLHKKRLVIKVDENLYEDTKTVKFLNLSMREVLDEFSSTGT